MGVSLIMISLSHRLQNNIKITLTILCMQHFNTWQKWEQHHNNSKSDSHKVKMMLFFYIR